MIIFQVAPTLLAERISLFACQFTPLVSRPNVSLHYSPLQLVFGIPYASHERIDTVFAQFHWTKPLPRVPVRPRHDGHRRHRPDCEAAQGKHPDGGGDATAGR